MNKLTKTVPHLYFDKKPNMHTQKMEFFTKVFECVGLSCELSIDVGRTPSSCWVPLAIVKPSRVNASTRQQQQLVYILVSRTLAAWTTTFVLVFIFSASLQFDLRITPPQFSISLYVLFATGPHGIPEHQLLYHSMAFSNSRYQRCSLFESILSLHPTRHS